MHVRQMRNSDEEWLLTKLEEYGVDDAQFRSRDYVLTVNSDNSGERTGFGRIYRHQPDGGEPYAQFANVITLGTEESRIQSLILRKLFKKALEYDCQTVYVIGTELGQTSSFDFELCESNEVPHLIADTSTDSDKVFKADVFDALDKKTEDERLSELADEFGYDEDETTTKYSI